jgi:hypothetical protein
MSNGGAYIQQDVDIFWEFTQSQTSFLCYLTTGTPDTQIYYEINGIQATLSSSVYSAPIEIDKNTLSIILSCFSVNTIETLPVQTITQSLVWMDISAPLADFRLPPTIVRPTVTAPTMTGDAIVASATITIAPTTVRPAITAPSISGVRVATISVPSTTVRPVTTAPSLYATPTGATSALFAMPTTTISPTVTAPALTAISMGTIAIPSTAVVLSINPPAMLGNSINVGNTIRSPDGTILLLRNISGTQITFRSING